MVFLNYKTNVAICCCGAFTIFVGSQIVEAQEICSEEEALTALSQLSCVADGAYLSPSAIANQIGERCADVETEEECNRCFRKTLKRVGKAFKDLSRANVLDRDWILAVRSAVFDLQDSTCAEISSSDGESSDQGGDNQGGYNSSIDHQRDPAAHPQPEDDRGPRDRRGSR